MCCTHNRICGSAALKPDFFGLFPISFLLNYPEQVLYPTRQVRACLDGCLGVEISFSNVDQRFLIVRLIGCLG